MDYALHAPHMHVPQRAIAPLVAFVIGGGVAVGIVAISGGLDSSSEASSPQTLIIHSSQGSQAPTSVGQQIGAQP